MARRNLFRRSSPAASSRAARRSLSSAYGRRSPELGDRWGEAATLDTIGYAYRDLGDHQQAVRFSELALDIDGELGDLHSEAIDAAHLGDALNAAGSTAQARGNWQLALDILDQLSDLPSVGAGYPDPDAIRAKLRSTGA